MLLLHVLHKGYSICKMLPTLRALLRACTCPNSHSLSVRNLPFVLRNVTHLEQKKDTAACVCTGQLCSSKNRKGSCLQLHGNCQ